MAKRGGIIMVFGTFDVLHKGHVNFLRQAKKHGSSLVVSIARDSNVKKIKGSKPWLSETKRAAGVKKLRIADKIVLGDKINYIRHIKKISPNIIALGYDQRGSYVKNLRRDLRSAGLQTKVIRLKAYQPHRYKSSKLKAKMIKFN